MFVGAVGNHSQPLSWNLYMKIALGAAKGLAYLHNEADVTCRDFKASNILLDSVSVRKTIWSIAEFGSFITDTCFTSSL